MVILSGIGFLPIRVTLKGYLITSARRNPRPPKSGWQDLEATIQHRSSLTPTGIRRQHGLNRLSQPEAFQELLLAAKGAHGWYEAEYRLEYSNTPAFRNRAWQSDCQLSRLGRSTSIRPKHVTPSSELVSACRTESRSFRNQFTHHFKRLVVVTPRQFRM